MKEIFISYAEEDGGIAAEIAERLEVAGYTTWYFQRDSLPGVPHLEQTSQAIEEASAVVLVISPAATGSHQVDTEVIHAHEAAQPIVPVLHGLSYAELRRSQPVWTTCLRAAAAISLSSAGPAEIALPLVMGLRALEVWPRSGCVTAGGIQPLRCASVNLDADTALVAITGEIDLGNCVQVREHLRNLLAVGVTRLVVDLSGVGYMDSAAIGTLVGVWKRLREIGGAMGLVNPNPRVRRLFEITSLSRVIGIYDTTEEALASFEARGAEASA
jgi:anti-sigma B factor antagonist